ncbi:ribonuclease H-like domain-containing protein [Gracilibacillus sp. Marseille-QA3620]
MSIKHKLNRMKAHLNTGNGDVKAKQIREPALKQTEIPHYDEWQEYGARAVFMEEEYCLIREVSYPLTHRHGKYTFDMLLDIVRIWNESDLSHPLSAKGIQADQLFFFDTETTGLGTGAGTSIFLLGYAFIEDGMVKVRQHFLPRPGYELPFYKTFLDNVQYEKLVTYNGKSFDWPQVVSQHTMLRGQLPKLPGFGHFDLYHAARRLWKYKLNRVKLAVVEEEVLGFKREDDIPGYLAPMIYFDYVDRHDPEAIFKIMKHNEQDVLSLISLYIHLSALLLNQEFAEHEDSFELARWFSVLKERNRAIQSFERGITESAEEDVLTVKFHLANEHKRSGNLRAAAELWEEAAMSNRSETKALSYLELAKYYEHRVKDYDTALSHAQAALDTVVRNQIQKAALKAGELQKRIERLERKCLQMLERIGK